MHFKINKIIVEIFYCINNLLYILYIDYQYIITNNRNDSKLSLYT